MKKSDIPVMPMFFDRYIHMNEDIDVLEALKKQSMPDNAEISLLTELGDFRYAPDKWTVKDVLQHIIDTERIQSYRAMCIARNDKNIFPGFDEQLYGETAMAVRRSVASLVDEFATVRRSTIQLFEHFDEEMLLRGGTCFQVKISVLALGFVMAGHQMHHFNILEERYYQR